MNVKNKIKEMVSNHQEGEEIVEHGNITGFNENRTKSIMRPLSPHPATCSIPFPGGWGENQNGKVRKTHGSRCRDLSR